MMTWNAVFPTAVRTALASYDRSASKRAVVETTSELSDISDVDRRLSVVNARLALYEAAARRDANENIMRQKSIDAEVEKREKEFCAKEEALILKMREFEVKRVEVARELSEKERRLEEQARAAKDALKEQRAELIALCEELERRVA